MNTILPLWTQILLIIIMFIVVVYLVYSLWRSNKDLEEKNKTLKRIENRIKKSTDVKEVVPLFDKNGNIVYFLLDSKLYSADSILHGKEEIIKKLNAK